MGHPAGIAQLVEHDLAKVGVEGPSPFSRSKIKKTSERMSFLFYRRVRTGPETPRGRWVRLNRHRARSAWMAIQNLERSERARRANKQPSEARGLRSE